MNLDGKNLDDQIKDALEGLQVPYDGASWDALASKISNDPELASDSEADKAFDSAVRGKIGNLEPQVIPSHWELMAEKIRKEFSFRERMMRYKVAEIGIMVLLLLTLIQYLPNHHALDLVPNSLKTKILDRLNHHVEPAEKKVDQPSRSWEKRNDLFINAGGGIPPVKQQSENQESEDIPSHSRKTLNSYHQNSLQPLKHASKPELIRDKDAVLSSAGLQQQFHNSLLPTSILALNNIEPQNNEFLHTTPAIKNAKETADLRVSMFSATDYNFIKTPYDPIYPLEEYGRYALGYGGGVTFGLSFGKWEVETGGIYASKEYEPRVPEEIVGGLLSTGIVTIRFDNIQLNMLEVPLNFRYNFGKLQNWRFYGQTGASLHMAMQAHYDRFPNNLFSSLSRQTIQNSTHIGKKEFPDGLLEGGSFEENSYFTANLGLGVERMLSTRWSLFLQPSVQAYLLPGYNYGLGPTQDRISTFSILTGARVTLW